MREYLPVAKKHAITSSVTFLLPPEHHKTIRAVIAGSSDLQSTSAVVYNQIINYIRSGISSCRILSDESTNAVVNHADVSLVKVPDLALTAGLSVGVRWIGSSLKKDDKHVGSRLQITGSGYDCANCLVMFRW